MYSVLVGAPGAGKGTQAVLLSEKLHLPHVASGDLFREAAAQGTPLGQTVKSYMEKGQLVPDEVTIKMVLERLASNDCKKGCIFDGFPRTLEQANALDKALSGLGKAIHKAIYIKVSEPELLKRLGGRWLCRKCQTPYQVVSSPPRKAGICDKCGGELFQRADDTEATVRERLKVYFAQTMPLLEYYRKQGKLVEVKGEGSIEQITKDILGALR